MCKLRHVNMYYLVIFYESQFFRLFASLSILLFCWRMLFRKDGKQDCFLDTKFIDRQTRNYSLLIIMFLFFFFFKLLITNDSSIFPNDFLKKKEQLVPKVKNDGYTSNVISRLMSSADLKKNHF